MTSNDVGPESIQGNTVARSVESTPRGHLGQAACRAHHPPQTRCKFRGMYEVLESLWALDAFGCQVQHSSELVGIML